MSNDTKITLSIVFLFAIEILGYFYGFSWLALLGVGVFVSMLIIGVSMLTYKLQKVTTPKK